MAEPEKRSAVRFLADQHDEIRELFSQLTDAYPSERRAVFEPLVRLLSVHETAEEMVVHPAARTAGTDAAAVVEACLTEEDRAKKMLADIEKHDPASARFAALLPGLREAVESHARREEQELFPLLEAVSDERQLQRMTSALELAESIAPTHPHKRAPESAIGNLLVGPVVSVVDRVRDRLRNVARRISVAR